MNEEQPGTVRMIPGNAVALGGGNELRMSLWILALLMPLAAWALSYLAVRDAGLGDSRILLLNTVPKAFQLGLVISVVAIVGLVAGVAFARRRGWELAALFLPVLVFGVGLVLLSLNPGAKSRGYSEYVPPRWERVVQYSIPVFFDTGSATISREEQQRLSQAITIANLCGHTGLSARGYASSTPYAVEIEDDGNICDSNCRNWRLAHLRANSLRDYVSAALNMRAEAHVWATPDEMIALRLKDIGDDAQVVTHLERLNRRAELRWTQVGCD